MSAAAAAVVSAITSVTVVVLSLLIGARQQRRSEERAERRALNASYLNPLRLHLVENHFRLADILQLVEAQGGVYSPIVVIADPAEVSDKDAGWFNGEGCALIGSVYRTACLFAQLKKVREDFPYLRLSGAEDTRLAELLLRVHLGFRQHQGVYYVTQPSLGEDLWIREEGRLRTYREFCELLQDPKARIWFDRLILLYVETAQGEKLDRIHHAIAAIGELAEFLDNCVGGGQSIRSRWDAEHGLRTDEWRTTPGSGDRLRAGLQDVEVELDRGEPLDVGEAHPQSLP